MQTLASLPEISSIKDMVRIVLIIKHGACDMAMNCLFKPVYKIECSNACVSWGGRRCHVFTSLPSANRSWRLFEGCFDVKSVKTYCLSHINVRDVQVCKNVSIKCNLT